MKPMQSISDLIIIWTGWNRNAWPTRDDTEIFKQFGEEAAKTILPKLHELEDAFYSSNAKYTANNLAEMTEMASSQFQARYPEISQDAVRALAWCYTFDFK